jgi:hypothetical protein
MKQPPNELTIIAKYNKKMNDKRYSLDRKYSKMLGLRKEKLEARKQKEIDRYEKKRKKLMDYEIKRMKEREKINEAKKINKAIKQWTTRKRKLRDTTKKLEKPAFVKSIPKLKKEALEEIQRYAKLSRSVWSTEWPRVFLVDKLERVPLKWVNGWHCYPQSNYAQLAFNLNNIRPISSIWNRKQLDTIWERKKNLPKEVIEKLDIEAENKTVKRSMRDRKFYEAIIEKYKELNKVEEKRLWIYPKNDKMGK